MTMKPILIVFGLLVAVAVLATGENHEESSLSEELGSSRVARSADAEAARRKRKTLRKRKRTQKKGLKKRNKNKSKRRKNTKRTKKTKKGKRKNNKRRKNKRKNNKGTRKSTRTLDGMCIENAVTAMKRWKDVVANFDKQKTRIEKQASIAGKKSGKQSVFGPIAPKLVDLGGGNKSALTCSGSATSLLLWSWSVMHSRRPR